MSHIRDRLKQYADKYSDCYKYAGVYVKVIQDMIDQLQGDLEQDEKENGWIPVSERLPEDERECLVTLEKVYGTPEKLYGIASYLKFEMPDTGKKINMGILNGINIQMGMEEQ